MSSERCPFCKRVDLTDPVVREALVREIREQSRDRFHMTESMWATLPTTARVGIGQYLARSLNRPPLDGSVPGWDELGQFFTALLFDVGQLTDDPASPMVNGMVVPQPHPDLSS